MKLLILFLVFSACTISTWALAADNETLGHSEQNRQNKDMTITAQVFGFGPSASITQGLNLGFFIDPNSMIMIELAQGSNPLIWFSSGYTIHTFSIATHYKLFVSNTFYIKLGVDLKRVDYRYEDSYLGSTYEKTEFVGNSLGAAFSLGNQWQWSAFTFGFDWIGISAPFASQIESSSATGAYPNQKRLERDETRYLKDNVMIFMHGYVGASF